MPKTIDVFYWLPHCSTCQKAEAHLKDRGVVIQRYHDLKAVTISEAELDQIIQLMGGAEALFSRRAMKYRSQSLDKMTLSEADLRRYMLEEYTFIKRPVLVTPDKQVLAGFSAKQYNAMFK